MSTPKHDHHKLVTRKQDVLGCNIRKGATPGGMASQQCTGAKRSHSPRSHKAVIEAANVSLEKRGWRHNPDALRDSISRHVAVAKAARAEGAL